MDRVDLQNVFINTQKIFETKKYNSTNKNTKKYNMNDLPIDWTTHVAYENTIIEVKNEDTLNMTIDYRNKGLNPLVLNMASHRGPGGGVRNGARAQEEDIFRRTNSHLLLSQSMYPLRMQDVLYTPIVTIIKNDKYEIIPDKEFSMVSCAALYNPELKNGKYQSNDYNLMYAKIKSLFRLAILHNHDSIVLGAFGCGAFNNPPEEVAEIYRILLKKYMKYFKRIGFAILVVKDKDQQNLVSFQNMINNINE